MSAFRVSVWHCESYSPMEWQPRKQRYRAGMDCRRIGATRCKQIESLIILHRSDEISLRVQVISGSNGPVARIATIFIDSTMVFTPPFNPLTKVGYLYYNQV